MIIKPSKEQYERNKQLLSEFFLNNKTKNNLNNCMEFTRLTGKECGFVVAYDSIRSIMENKIKFYYSKIIEGDDHSVPIYKGKKQLDKKIGVSKCLDYFVELHTHPNGGNFMILQTFLDLDISIPDIKRSLSRYQEFVEKTSKGDIPYLNEEGTNISPIFIKINPFLRDTSLLELFQIKPLKINEITSCFSLEKNNLNDSITGRNNLLRFKMIYDKNKSFPYRKKYKFDFVGEDIINSKEYPIENLISKLADYKIKL